MHYGSFGRGSYVDLGREMVQIKVGPEEVVFSIHKSLICHYSQYFKAAFTSGYEETKTGVMKLPETSVEVFEVFNRWLYHQSLWSPEKSLEGNIPKKERDKRGCPLDSLVGLNKLMDVLMRLYVFADMTRIHSLMNQILDDLNLISDITRTIPTTAFAYVWDNVSDSSPVRQFIVDWILWEVDEGSMDDDANEYPSDLRLEVMKAARNVVRRFCNREKPKYPKLGICMNYYYVPEDENNKEKESTKDSKGN